MCPDLHLSCGLSIQCASVSYSKCLFLFYFSPQIERLYSLNIGPSVGVSQLSPVTWCEGKHGQLRPGGTGEGIRKRHPLNSLGSWPSTQNIETVLVSKSLLQFGVISKQSPAYTLPFIYHAWAQGVSFPVLQLPSPNSALETTSLNLLSVYLCQRAVNPRLSFGVSQYFSHSLA